jgi:hypothetical protein
MQLDVDGANLVQPSAVADVFAKHFQFIIITIALSTFPSVATF